MTKRTIPHFGKLTLLALFAFGVFSCSDDKEDDVNIALTEAEVQTILETEALAGVADNALAEIFAGNSASGKSARTTDCYIVDQTESGFTATFNNCVLNDTDQVNGTVTVTYAQGMESGAFTATYTNFLVGDIKLNGTRTLTITGSENLGTATLSALSDMTIEMADGQMIDLEGTRSIGISIGDSLDSIGFSVNGNWTVKIASDTYGVTITNTLKGSGACENFTEGVMKISKNGINLTVDFGDGTCDTLATVTYPNGATEEINLED